MADKLHRITIFSPAISSGTVSFDCKPGRSFLSAAYKAKVEFPLACKNGVCEICKAQLLSGQAIQKQGSKERLFNIDDKPQAVNPSAEIPQATKLTTNKAILDEDNQVLLCRIYPQSDITLSMTKVASATQRPINTLACQVASVNELNSCTWHIELLAPAGTTLDYLAGQYLELELVGQQLPYSIANAFDPAEPRRLELIIHVTTELAEQVLAELKDLAKQKATVKVTLPKGDCYLQTPLHLTHVMVAAGSGISQIKCLTEEILKQQPDADIELYWSNKDADDFYLLDEIEKWLDVNENFNFTPILEQPHDEWPGRTGMLFEVIAEDFEDLNGAQMYLCGSPQMVYGTLDNLKDKDIQLDDCFSDVFAYAPRN